MSFDQQAGRRACLIARTLANKRALRPHWRAATGKREGLHHGAEPASARGCNIYQGKSIPLEVLRGLTIRTGS